MSFPTGPKLRGYGSYDAFSNFKKKIFTSYEVTKLQKLRWFLRASADVFPYWSQVARLRKLRCFFKFSKKIFTSYEVTKLQKLRWFLRASADVFPYWSQVARLR